MKLLLNNRPEEIDGESITLQGLIKVKNYTFKLLVTKVNGVLVKKVDRDSFEVKDGDKVDVIHMISGG